MLMNPSRRNHNQPNHHQHAEPGHIYGLISRESAQLREQQQQNQHVNLPTISDLYTQLILSGSSEFNDPHLRQAVNDYKKFLDYYYKMKRIGSSNSNNKNATLHSTNQSHHTCSSHATNCKSNVNTNSECMFKQHDCKLAPFRYEENRTFSETIKIPSIDQLTKHLIPHSFSPTTVESRENSMNSEKKRSRHEEVPTQKAKKVKQNTANLIQISPTEILQSSTSTVYISKQQAKLFDSVKGTTCHQCKQKTLDTKTNCNQCCKPSLINNYTNGRGVFCTNCLKNRYGEELEDVLKNENWSCPVCREICNCSSCRRKAGKEPISITTREALKKGYKSVHDMLVANNKI